MNKCTCFFFGSLIVLCGCKSPPTVKASVCYYDDKGQGYCGSIEFIPPAKIDAPTPAEIPPAKIVIEGAK